MAFDQKCQLLIVGDSTVGKTSILLRFAQDKFNPNYLATVGIGFFTKDVIIEKKKIHVKMWDTAGQERYKSLTAGFFRNGQGILIVYDVKNEHSFENLKYWIESIQNNATHIKNIPKIIIGNKIDIKDREISKEKAEEFANNYNCKYFEVSAKTGEGIDVALKYLIKKVLEYIDKEEGVIRKESITIKKSDNNNDKKDKKSCCNKQ